MLFYCKILFFCRNKIVSIFRRQLRCVISCRENFLESKALHFLIYDWPVCITIPDHQSIAVGVGRFCPLEVCTDISRTWLNCHFRQFGYKQVGQVCIQRASITNYHRTIQLSLTSHYLIWNIALDGLETCFTYGCYKSHVRQCIFIACLTVESNIARTWRICSALSNALAVTLLIYEKGILASHCGFLCNDFRGNACLVSTPWQNRLTPCVGISAFFSFEPLVVFCTRFRGSVSQLRPCRRNHICWFCTRSDKGIVYCTNRQCQL